MPTVPPAVATVDAGLDEFTRRLVTDLRDASETIDREIAEILERWPGQTKPVRLGRLRELQRHVAGMMTNAAATARATLPEALASSYAYGATMTAIRADAAATFAAVDRSSLSVLVRDTYRDLLAATEHMTDTTKDVVRRLGRDHARDALVTGRTAQQAARRLAADLQGEGIAAIVYRNGARHGLADYSDMLIRTKSAEAFQLGGFRQGAALGIEWWEIMDNPSCGIDGHNDPTKANGQIVRRETAERFPLSHPRCVRVTTPRPDIESREQANAARASLQTPSQVADQALVEIRRGSEDWTRRVAGTQLEERSARGAAGTLTPTSGTARSPAARRRAAGASRTARTGSTASRKSEQTVARRQAPAEPPSTPTAAAQGDTWRTMTPDEIRAHNGGETDSQVARRVQGRITTAVRRGNVTVMAEPKLTRAQLAGLLADVDNVIARAPARLTDGFTVHVPSGDPKFRQSRRGTTMGYVVERTTRLFLNPKLLGEVGDATNPALVAQWMPASGQNSMRRYVITHELGHVLDGQQQDMRAPGIVLDSGTRLPSHFRDEAQALHREHRHELSKYGGTNPAEGYAEAFAQWVLGGPGSSPVADEFARRFGWR